VFSGHALKVPNAQEDYSTKRRAIDDNVLTNEDNSMTIVDYFPMKTQKFKALSRPKYGFDSR